MVLVRETLVASIDASHRSHGQTCCCSLGTATRSRGLSLAIRWENSDMLNEPNHTVLPCRDIRVDLRHPELYCELVPMLSRIDLENRATATPSARKPASASR